MKHAIIQALTIMHSHCSYMLLKAQEVSVLVEGAPAFPGSPAPGSLHAQSYP